MRNDKYTLINNETGEVVELNNFIKEKKKAKITKQLVDAMLKQANNLDDIDVDLLARWVRITQQINNYGQVKLLGAQRNIELEKEMINDATILCYVYRILYSTHPFSCAIMKNHKTKVSTWAELWELIDCKNKKTQSKIKKFLTEKSLVRELVVYEGANKKSKQFYLNPFLLRNSGYASQIAINCFKDYAKESINMNSYIYRFLQCVGILDDFQSGV